jgi:putative peptidoglycan lipid II flippase
VTEPARTDTGDGTGILRSSVVVAVGTGLSRVTGLLRTMAIAYALGTLVLGDAYNLANNTPNVIYDLVLGGILAATLVPVAVAQFEADDEDGIHALATVITLVLVALTVVATLLSPLIIDLYTIDLRDTDPAVAEQQTSIAVPLLLMFMPQVLFYGISTLWTALLNARRSFAAPAFAPVLNNAIVICLFLALPRLVTGELTVDAVLDDDFLLLLVGIGTTSGIVAMTLVLWPALRRAGIRLRWNPDFRHPAVRTIARLSAWTFGYVIANQVVFFVVAVLINGQGTGAYSSYFYAWQFFQLPYGLFTVSIMTTFTPELATHITRNDLPAFRERFTQGLRLGLLVILPAAALFLTLADPTITVLLERGNFGDASTELTSSVLAWLAIGLPGFAVFLYSMRGFYAMQDTRTPFVLNMIENVIQVALALTLVGPFGVQGVIAAFSVAYTIGAAAALLTLRARVHGLGGRAVAQSAARLVTAAVAMAGAVWGLTTVIEPDGTMRSLALLGAGAVAGLAVYLGILVLLRSPDLAMMRTLMRPRSGGTENAAMP